MERNFKVLQDKLIRQYENTRKHINHFYNAIRRNKLTQKDCAIIIYDVRIIFQSKRLLFLKNHDLPISCCRYRVASEESIEREIQRWDKMLNERRETKKCPPDGYSREKNASDFKNWIIDIEKDKYQIWEDNLITRLMLKEKKSGLCQAHYEEDEENQENENDYLDRYNKDLTILTDHITKRD